MNYANTLALLLAITLPALLMGCESASTTSSPEAANTALTDKTIASTEANAKAAHQPDQYWQNAQKDSTQQFGAATPAVPQIGRAHV